VDFVGPIPLAFEHEFGDFSCGRTSLDDWLKQRSRSAQKYGDARSFVLLDSPGSVAGYYSLAAASVAREVVHPRQRRNSPRPIPAILIARLAVDSRFQGRGLGARLLTDALLRALAASESIGARLVLVHVLDEQAASFYAQYGFVRSPALENLMLMRIVDLRATVERRSPL
jgi:GNAT superfamily N-acetyltransferase